MMNATTLKKLSFFNWFHLFTATVAVADSPSLKLALPVDCEIGSICHIQNFFDHDESSVFHDYHCGVLGYDGHDGTDIRLPNLSYMEKGVTVLAAADGRVRAIRDEMPDISIREPGRLEAIRGKEAGNAVAINHGNGWETQYSHLKLGSVRVKPGQRVKTGEVLGLIGLSGKTEFPHVHFEVRYKGESVDPFVGLGPKSESDCGLGKYPLWDERTLALLGYQPTGLLQAGFAAGKPESKRIKAGEYQATQLSTTTPALVFWVELFGIQKGDIETIRITAPDGTTFVETTNSLPKNKARRFSYVGKKRRSNEWSAGLYKAHYELLRNRAGSQETIISISRDLHLF